MKTPSTFLYDLVHQLSKSERRYIEVQAGSKEKDYIQLMDALIAQKKFDEDQLIKKNKGANFLKHLAVNKRYLYELLLKSLANFGQKSIEDKVFEKITAANVLIAKNLHVAAFSELKKGQKIAEKYESFELQILICGIEKQLLAQQQFKTKEDSAIHQIYKVEMNCLDQLKNTTEYWYLARQIAQFQIQFLKIQTKEQQQFIDTLTHTPKFQDSSLATNFKSKLYYYQANSTYYFMLGDVAQAYEINRQFLDFLEVKPHFLRLYAERYLATLNNMLIDSLVIGKYDILEEGLKRLVLIPERKEFKTIKNIASRVFRQRYLLLMNWCINQQDFEKAMKWIPEIEAGLQHFGKKIEKHHRITFYYLSAYLLFQNRHFEQALEWNNRILAESKENVVKEIFYFARSLNLLIHYELGNYTLLESLLLSTPKYLRARRELYQTEKSLFRLLGKLIDCIDKKEKQKLLTNFKEEIHTLFQRPKEKRVFNYMDLRLWVD